VFCFADTKKKRSKRKKGANTGGKRKGERWKSYPHFNMFSTENLVDKRIQKYIFKLFFVLGEIKNKGESWQQLLQKISFSRNVDMRFFVW